MGAEDRGYVGGIDEKYRGRDKVLENQTQEYKGHRGITVDAKVLYKDIDR